jgi:signal transduction histidine kinase
VKGTVFGASCLAAFLALLRVLHHLRIRELQRKEQELREVIATIPAFAWTALPSGTAATNAGVCLRLLNPNEPDVRDARDAALEMTKNARRAADIIARVRLLYQTGHSQLEPADINEVIAEMVTMARSPASLTSVTMRTEPGEGLMPVMAGRLRLQQVFMNLMLKGTEVMKENGGQLTIMSRPGENGQLVVSAFPFTLPVRTAVSA